MMKAAVRVAPLLCGGDRGSIAGGMVDLEMDGGDGGAPFTEVGCYACKLAATVAADLVQTPLRSISVWPWPAGGARRDR